MPLGTEGDVEQMQRVQDADGNPAPPASDAESHVTATDIDINNNGDGATVELVGPSRAEQLTVHVEPDADAEVVVHFLDEEGGERITSRDKSENSGFASAGGADIFGRIKTLPSRFIEIDITDTSGGSNTAAYQFRVI